MSGAESATDAKPILSGPPVLTQTVWKLGFLPENQFVGVVLRARRGPLTKNGPKSTENQRLPLS
jgi:hypothetical protein